MTHIYEKLSKKIVIRLASYPDYVDLEDIKKYYADKEIWITKDKYFEYGFDPTRIHIDCTFKRGDSYDN